MKLVSNEKKKTTSLEFALLNVGRGKATILQNILILRHEDLTLPEREHGQEEENNPDDDHHHGHDCVPNEKALELEDVTQRPDGRNPPDCRRVSSARKQRQRRIRRTIRESQRPASENFVEVLVDFEPVGQHTEDEEEHCKTEEHHRSHHTGGEPDLARLGSDEAVQR